MFTSVAQQVYQRPSGVWIPCDSRLGSFEKSRGISPFPGFQFWPKSESLGLNGTQHLPGPGLPILAEVRFTGPQWHPTTVRIGESPQSRAFNSGWSLNHWASMAPNCSNTHVQWANVGELAVNVLKITSLKFVELWLCAPLVVNILYKVAHCIWWRNPWKYSRPCIYVFLIKSPFINTCWVAVVTRFFVDMDKNVD
jgi:hypothetical protein